MKTKNKTDRSRPKRFLSVVPVTSRETTGTTVHQINIRTALTLRIKQITRRIENDKKLATAYRAALQEIIKAKKGD